MSRELLFTGYWEGDAVYSCDCPGCNESKIFSFDSDDIDSKLHRKILRENNGWITTKVNGEWRDFCSEECRNKFIKMST